MVIAFTPITRLPHLFVQHKDRNMIETISIFAGHGKTGQAELFGRIDLHMGQVVSIVGPTGSGKTTLINDLELFADGDTPSGRRC